MAMTQGSPSPKARPCVPLLPASNTIMRRFSICGIKRLRPFTRLSSVSGVGSRDIQKSAVGWTLANPSLSQITVHWLEIGEFVESVGPRGRVRADAHLLTLANDPFITDATP